MNAVLEARASVDGLLDDLELGLSRITDDFKQFLAMQARFHKYSLGNQILIAFSRPDATKVAGFRVWQQLGRQVMKGEKGIAILAPCFPRKKRDADEATEDEEPDKRRDPIYFRVVHVFDISQTEGDSGPEAPEWPIITGARTQHLRGALQQYLEDQDIHIVLSPPEPDAPQGARGYWRARDRKLWIDSTLPLDQQTATMAHEAGHAILGHKGGGHRGTSETQAQSVAFVVSGHFGFEIGDVTFPYLLEWAVPPENPQEGIRNLKKDLSTIKEAANQIIEGVAGYMRVESVGQHQEYSWADWLGQVAGLQQCGNVHEQILDDLVAGAPIPDTDAETLQEWLTCLQDQAFLIPIGDALEGARRELTSIRQGGSTEDQELFARYEVLLDEHSGDPCTKYIWLAKRTHRFRDRASLTLSQWRRLTGKRFPGKANLLPGRLIPWETAIDEVAFDMGIDTDKFERCVLRAFDRQFELFDLLAQVLAKERGSDEISQAAQGEDAAQGPRGINPHDGRLLPLCAECVGPEGSALLHRTRGSIRGQVQVGLELEQVSTGAYLKKLGRDTCRSARECVKAILDGADDESCDAVRQTGGELSGFGQKQGRLFGPEAEPATDPEELLASILREVESKVVQHVEA